MGSLAPDTADVHLLKSIMLQQEDEDDEEDDDEEDDNELDAEAGPAGGVQIDEDIAPEVAVATDAPAKRKGRGAEKEAPVSKK